MAKNQTKAADDSSTKDSLLRQAYGAATARLRDAYRAEFNKLYAEEAAARNVEWKPRPTEEEKAEAQLAALLAAHPNLREKVVQSEGEVAAE